MMSMCSTIPLWCGTRNSGVVRLSPTGCYGQQEPEGFVSERMVAFVTCSGLSAMRARHSKEEMNRYDTRHECHNDDMMVSAKKVVARNVVESCP